MNNFGKKMFPALTPQPPLKLGRPTGRSNPCTALGLPPLRRRLSVAPSNRASTASRIPQCFWKEAADVISYMEKELGSMTRQRDMVELSKNPTNLLLWSKGRPEGVSSEYSLKPLVPRLSQLLGVEVKMANDCIGKEFEEMVAQLSNGGVLLLENVRFYQEEEKNDPKFAEKLASLAGVYVNDAFSAAHRAHASTEGLTKFLKPSIAGFQMQKELDYLVQCETIPKKPFATVVGGNDLSTKYGVIEFLLSHVDVLLLGGGMIYTFYKAQGNSIELFLVEEDKIHLATSLIEKAKAKGVSLLLPTDVVVGEMFAIDATKKSLMEMRYVGVFATKIVANEAIANNLAELNDYGVKTIIVGDKPIAAVKNLGLADKMSHIYTEDDASLMVLKGKHIPGVIAFDISYSCTSLFHLI